MSEEPKEVTAEDTDAVLSTAAELGPAYEGALAESFADRVERVIEARVADRSRALEHRTSSSTAAGTRQMVLGIVSLGAGIPLTAIAANLIEPGLIGVLITWLGIVGVNIAHALAGNRPR